MKGLSPKKKIEYYIQYYGAATAVILIVIIAVTSFGVGRIRAKDVAEGMRTCSQIINMNKVSIDD